jgi:hypothetical protein
MYRLYKIKKVYAYFQDSTVTISLLSDRQKFWKETRAGDFHCQMVLSRWAYWYNASPLRISFYASTKWEAYRVALIFPYICPSNLVASTPHKLSGGFLSNLHR